MPRSDRESLHWDTYADSFGFRLLILRRERGLSQEQLAFRSGMHRNQVSNLERGTSNRAPYVSDPHLSTVYRLARALEVPPAYLLPDIENLLERRSPEQESNESRSSVEEQLLKLLAEQS